MSALPLSYEITKPAEVIFLISFILFELEHIRLVKLEI